MTPELSRRVAHAMNRGFPSLDERKQILAALEGAQEFKDLPKEIRKLIKSFER